MPIEFLQRNDQVLTIFSTGQMTSSKGIDRIPKFLNELMKVYDREIRWIVVARGTSVRNKVINEMKNLCNNSPNISFVYFESVPHDAMNYLFSISDVYLMLHRVSIFDIATLEAMYHNLHVILSDIPGNDEFNVENNILLVPEDDKNFNYNTVINYVKNVPSRNRAVYEKYFGNEVFQRNYKALIDDLADV